MVKTLPKGELVAVPGVVHAPHLMEPATRSMSSGSGIRILT